MSYFLPRLLTPADSHDVAQGVDVYIGQKRKVKKVGDTFKISLDGVEYIVLGDDIESGDSVIVTGKK